MAKTKREQEEHEEAVDAQIREAWVQARFVFKSLWWVIVVLTAVITLLSQFVLFVKEITG